MPALLGCARFVVGGADADQQLELVAEGAHIIFRSIRRYAAAEARNVVTRNSPTSGAVTMIAECASMCTRIF